MNHNNNIIMLNVKYIIMMINKIKNLKLDY